MKKISTHTYFILLSIIYLFCGCARANVLLKDAEKVNEDLIKMEVDAQNPLN